MALTTPKHFEFASPPASTYDAMREMWWWMTGSHPTVANGTNWACVEVYDGTTREVPSGGNMDNLSGGSLWKPSASPSGSLPEGAWAVFRNLGGQVTAQCQFYTRMEASAEASNSLISLDDWSVGAGPDATPTLPATIIGQPVIGEGDGRFPDSSTLIWSVILDEGMFLMHLFDPAGGAPSSARWTYMGEVDSVVSETNDPRPFLTARTVGQTNWTDSFSHVRISAVDQSTVCNLDNQVFYRNTQALGLYDDLGVQYLSNVAVWSTAPAGHRFIMGYFRNAGGIHKDVVSNRATAGYTPTDFRFEVWDVGGIGNPQVVTLWPPGTALGAGHILVTEESVPTQLIPAVINGGGGDTTPPVVTYVDPLPGAQITPTIATTIDVTDDSGGFSNIQLRVRYNNADPQIPTETIYGGDKFAEFESLYRSSTIATITDGFRFVLTRDDGWPSTPTFIASPIDSSGNTV